MGMEEEEELPQLRVFSPEAKERRARNVRIVKWFVGGCLALVAIAGIRHLFRTEEPLPAPPSMSSATASTAAAPSAEPTAPAASASAASSAEPTAVISADAAVAAAVTDASATPTSASPDDASAASATTDAAAPTATDPAEAAKEKAHAKNALESGRSKEAITAGERSVSLDPTDADAWLYLGAAYQEQGDQVNANRCYRACLAQGTHGNKGECAMMMK